MKKILFAVFAMLWLEQRPALASQIVVGLRSDNLISWGVWERQGTTLKHYLLLYNKSSQPLEITIRAADLRSAGTGFAEASAHHLVHRQQLASHQLVRLPYPKNSARPGVMGLLEYFENRVSVGLLPINTSSPDATALSGEPYQFYTNEGANSSEMNCWLAFNSLSAPPAHLRLTAAPAHFRRAAPLGRGEEAYYLAKLYPSYAEVPSQPGTLDSLVAVGHDLAISRLDSAHQTALVPVGPGTAAPQPTRLVLLTESIEKFYRYDKQRQLVADKSVGGAIHLIPLFPQNQ